MLQAYPFLCQQQPIQTKYNVIPTHVFEESLQVMRNLKLRAKVVANGKVFMQCWAPCYLCLQRTKVKIKLNAQNMFYRQHCINTLLAAAFLLSVCKHLKNEKQTTCISYSKSCPVYF